MTSRFEWDDARIHAYVDGALDEETAARLEAESRSDAGLEARIERQRNLRARLRAELDPVLEEPIPQRLFDALERPGAGSAVTPIGAAHKAGVRAARSAWSRREWGALAATLVLGVLVGQFAFRGSSDLPIENESGRVVAEGYLDAALSTQLSGAAPAGAEARIGLSFRTGDGDYCRTFALRGGAGGLACRRGNRWSVELLERSRLPASGPDDFRQASSALSPAMLGAIGGLGAGEPLSAEEERQLVNSAWRDD